MNAVASARTAVRAVRRNKLRSALAVVGIVIAVAAVVATVALGAGAKVKVAQEMASLGLNMLTISPGAVSSHGTSSGAGGAQTLTLEDAQAVERELGSVVAAVAPLNKGGAQIISGGNNWFAPLFGTVPAYLSIRDWPLAMGEPFTDEDVAAGAKVCLLGQTVRERLFGDASPLGAEVRVQRMPCRVVGVLSPKGAGNGQQDQDDVVIMPWSTLVRRVEGAQGQVLNHLLVGARSPRVIDEAESDVRLLLRQRHHLAVDAPDDFRIRNLADMQKSANSQTRTLSLLLSAIALDFPDRRRHRHRQRDARLGHRAHARDRHPHGGRGERPGRALAVSRRSGGARRGGRIAGALRRRGGGGADGGEGRVAHALVAGRDGGSGAAGRPRRRGRGLLSRAARIAPRSHRRVEIRVKLPRFRRVAQCTERIVRPLR